MVATAEVELGEVLGIMDLIHHRD
uniref:Uncharacterized protein n=1 Tax=Arundo donax TaxID=35708 RepID=A0A0A9BAL9_ARUDO